ncbi:MAG: alpha/beta hydrolase [Rikenellaceae bacterium]|jgi:acetyl esterase/lipase|nr:alpha/beta hydrolase [Rikenellaceae bacterium]
MKKILLYAALLLPMGNLCAQMPGGFMNFGDQPAAVPSPLAVNLDFSEAETTPVAEGAVEVLKGVVYVDRDGTELHLNILYPKNATGPLPCIIYIPGSAWMKQNIDMSIPNLERFAARGYVMALVEYRPSSEGQFPAQVQDAKTAMRFMRKNAELYHVDTNNVFVWGDSSGGHTALMVGFTVGIPEMDTDVYGEYSDQVNAIADYFGPSDLVTLAGIPNMLNQNPETSPEAMLIGGSIAANPEKARKASPVFAITADVPPTLVAHGDKDFLVPLSQSDEVAEGLEKAGVDYEYYCLLGGGHETREFWTDGMFDIVDKFFRRNMK